MIGISSNPFRMMNLCVAMTVSNGRRKGKDDYGKPTGRSGKVDELGKCCGSCKHSAIGFRETCFCTNLDKEDREPMYDVFDCCELWEEK